MKRKLDIGKKRLIGYAAGILAGVSYGTNPLFGKALMESGVPILVMLFFRYGIAAAILAVWMLLRKEAASRFSFPMTISRPGWPRHWCTCIRYSWP